MRATPVTLLPLAAILLLAGSAHAATVYKWVDAQGVIHYSDQPHPQAQELDVQGPKTVQSVVPSSGPSPSSKSAQSGAAPLSYSRCELYRPENDEVFLNTSTMTAKVRLEPQLSGGDQLFIAIDGRRVPNQPTNSPEFVLNDLERGTHTVLAVVMDSTGKQVLCTTPTVTFHVRQPSVQAPVKAVRPRF